MDIYEIRKRTAYEESILPTPKSETQNWLRGMSSEFQFAVTLTLKQSMLVKTERANYVRKLKRSDCDAIAHRFIQKMNRQVFGKASERYGKSLRFVPIVQGVRTDKNLHFHMAVGNFPSSYRHNEFPIMLKNAINLVAELDREHDVKIMDSGWIDYFTQELGRKDTDDVLWHLM